MKKTLFIIVLLLTVTLASCKKVPEHSVTLPKGKDIINVGEEWTDSGCTITIDNKDYEMTRTNSVDILAPSDYEVLYTYQIDDFEFTCTRMVKVLDQGYPTINLNPGFDTVKKYSTHLDAGITIGDNQTEDHIIEVTNDVNTNKTGTYTITYKVTDLDGNIVTAVRKVNVIN